MDYCLSVWSFEYGFEEKPGEDIWFRAQVELFGPGYLMDHERDPDPELEAEVWSTTTGEVGWLEAWLLPEFHEPGFYSFGEHDAIGAGIPLTHPTADDLTRLVYFDQSNRVVCSNGSRREISAKLPQCYRVPEPASAGLLIPALFALAVLARRGRGECDPGETDAGHLS
ncbi:MAG TPA: VPLPA-CTERM sorting domain-containing protein [Longimicrobiales bacterium]|nr:VPLPA-CTERM sorting domain-containing protein [Longimicrobiales bacterium]